MNRRYVAVCAGGVVAIIVFATISPLNDRPHLTQNADIERFAAYGLAGLLLGVSYPRRFLWTVLFLVSLAFILEGLQLLTPDRHAHVSDMSVKAVGGLAGVFVAGLILRLRRSDQSPP